MDDVFSNNKFEVCGHFRSLRKKLKNNLVENQICVGTNKTVLVYQFNLRLNHILALK